MPEKDRPRHSPAAPKQAERSKTGTTSASDEHRHLDFWLASNEASAKSEATSLEIDNLAIVSRETGPVLSEIKENISRIISGRSEICYSFVRKIMKDQFTDSDNYYVNKDLSEILLDETKSLINFDKNLVRIEGSNYKKSSNPSRENTQELDIIIEGAIDSLDYYFNVMRFLLEKKGFIEGPGHSENLTHAERYAKLAEFADRFGASGIADYASILFPDPNPSKLPAPRSLRPDDEAVDGAVIQTPPDSFAQSVSPPPWPNRAPRLWKDRGKQGDNDPFPFIRETYGPWLDGFTITDLRRIDGALAKQVTRWVNDHPLPDDVKIDMKTKPQRTDLFVARVKEAHAKGEEPLFTLREARRILKAASRRGEGLSK